jgi:N-acetylglucosamine-6-phosphate deacetylase
MMSHNEHLILSGATIYTENAVLKNTALVIKNQKIENIISATEINQYPSAKIINFPEQFSVVPGFIDMHIHGVNGHDVMDASFNALATISETLASEGTTSYLATTMTAAPNDIENVLCHIQGYMQQQNKVTGATILGVHLEGPFLSANKVGAQRSDFILNPDVQWIKQWQHVSQNSIKLVTLAPELENSVEMIRYLKQHNIIASIGHTNATYAETCDAIAAGCSHVTHLFNAMRGMHQREPGVVTAALLANHVTAEIIVDGVHLHPAIVELIFKLKKSERMVLVTDSMRAKCLPDGFYDLGGQEVEVKEGVASLANGVLAGSTLKMSDAIVKMMKYSHCTLRDIIKMTSENPAKSLGIFNQRGSISPGKIADIVVLDGNFKIELTLCRGKIKSLSQRALRER